MKTNKKYNAITHSVIRVILLSCISYNTTSNLFSVYNVNLSKSFANRTFPFFSLSELYLRQSIKNGPSKIF